VSTRYGLVTTGWSYQGRPNSLMIGATAIAAYIAYWSDKRKRNAEAVAILNKYRDPLVLSAVTLHHKLARLFPESEGHRYDSYIRKT
jgi:hypothetical protein